MKKFVKNLLYALIPIVALNLICWGALVVLSWQDDLTYVNYASALDKEKRLNALTDTPRLVIIGGSNTRFGFNCQILKDSLGMEPVNMGIHIGLGLNYMFEQVAEHLKAGDVLLMSAEYQNFMDMQTYLGDEGLTDMYLMKHQWGKAFSHMVDTHNYFSMYRLINRRIKRIGMNIEDIPERMEVRTKYNKYGDYIGHYNLSPQRWNTSSLSTFSAKEVLSDLVLKINHLRKRGVKVLLLPPPYCESSYKVNSLSISNLADQLRAADISFCVEPEVCVYPDSLYYDSEYHLNGLGVERHSKGIVKVLSDLAVKRHVGKRY